MEEGEPIDYSPFQGPRKRQRQAPITRQDDAQFYYDEDDIERDMMEDRLRELREHEENDYESGRDDYEEDDYGENYDFLVEGGATVYQGVQGPQVGDLLREAVIRMCLQIARNDETLLYLEDDWFKAARKSAWLWSDSDLMLLGKALVGNTHFQTLSLRMVRACSCRGPMPLRAAQALCRGIAQSQLKKVTLTRICTHYINDLCDGAGTLPGLESFYVSETMITPYIINKIALMLQPLPSTPESLSQPVCGRGLIHLSFVHCDITNLDLLTLSLRLSHNRSLQTLILTRNLISNMGVIYFCQNWKDDSPLQVLNLSSNRIGSQGARVLLEATTRHPQLKELLLFENRGIGHEGFRWVGEHLASTHLQRLDLHNCVNQTSNGSLHAQIDACRALANGLRHCTTMKRLVVGGNNLSARGVTMIMQALANHPSIRVISIKYDYSIDLAGVHKIGLALLRMTQLQQLNLDYAVEYWPRRQTKLALKAGQALLDGVKHNIHLTNFSFGGLDQKWRQPIKFHVNLNKICRPLLGSAVSSALWPDIFAKFVGSKKISRVYFLLREQPWLAGRSAVAANRI
jgi:Ran GTPase-activating protein (RanGAP) involved in mRNA processing and transport